MRKAILRPGWAAFMALALFGLVSCILGGDNMAKRGSEVENEVYGVLVALDGKPVPGAKVKAVPAPAVAKRGAGAQADSDSVVTDAKGRYAFKGLESGRYNLYGDYESGTLVVLIPGVDRPDTADPVYVGVDTLRAPGRIRGRVLLGDEGREGVLAYVPGTSYLAVSDDSGRLVIGGVPQGTHSVRYSAAGFVIEPDTGVRVESGRTTDLPVKRLAHDPALPPPAPTGLKAVYDTLNGRVLLSWDSVPVADLDGYVIYRDKPAFLDPQVLPDGFTRETRFIDTHPGVPAGMGQTSLVYRLKARDREVNLSLSYSAPAEVQIVSREWVTTRIELEIAGLRNGSASIGDSLLFLAKYSNPTRRSLRLEWLVDGIPVVAGMPLLPSLSGQASLPWKAGLPGERNLEVRITDEAGTVWAATRALDIREDAPVATAGADTTVSIGDAVHLRGMAADGFGSIVMREWDAGATGTFLPTQDGELRVNAPPQAGNWPCIFRVRDDDGKVGLDTLMVTVLLDPPVALAGPDTVVSIGDTLLLRGKAGDRYGSIRTWEWDVGGTGAFRSSGPDTVATAPAMEDPAFACILRVTDDDGVSRSDTLLAKVVLDAPVVDLGPDRVASLGDSLDLRASARDGFGRIAAYEWDPGASGSFVPGASLFPLRLPDRPTDAYRVVVRVTDDDGIQDLDTLAITVAADAPVAVAAAEPGEYFIGDSVRVTGAGSRDGYGRVVRWEWDPGAKGTFLPPGTDVLVVVPPDSGSFPVILRVTDDDGQIGLDTVTLLVHAAGGKHWFQSSSALPGLNEIYGHAMVEFAGRLWILGGSGNASVLSSTDGRSWTAAADAPFGRDLIYHTATVFRDQIWVIGGAIGGDTTKPGQVWRSSDGINWSRTAGAPVGNLRHHAAAVHKGELIVIGGLRAAEMDSVWVTTDGTAWKGSSVAATLGARSGHAAAVLDGRIFVICGDDGFIGGNPGGAVWSSADGLSWTKVLGTPDVPFPKPSGKAAAVHDGRIWILQFNHLYSSADGATWETVSGVMAQIRYLHALASFRNRLWLVGGDQVQPPDTWFTR